MLGFNWGIDPASPETVHEAQFGMSHPPPRLDHDALADSVIDRRTIYRVFAKGAWTVVDTQELTASSRYGHSAVQPSRQ